MNTKHKILYVDDEEINRELFVINFTDFYTIFTATDGYDGLKRLDNDKDISIVISDMKMPGINGLEFIKKAQQKYPNMKFYILTGFEISNDIKEALNEGIILDFFSKPFGMKQMHKIIEKTLHD